MIKTKPLKKVALIFLFTAMAIAQDTRPTVAILDFEGQGISEQEVQTLSERMRSEIGATNAVRLIERKAIENIMAEQGLAQSGCVSDECAAEVGQLLGVQFMVNGTIGKLGDKYTIDAKMFSVETGAAERTVSATHEGDVSGLLVEMQILAWEIVGLQAPQRLRLQRAGEIDKQYTEEAGSVEMSKSEIVIRIVMGKSSSSESVWTTDLSYDYVKINAEYRT